MSDKASEIDPTLVEKGERLVEYLDTPFEEGGPGPSDGKEMETIVIKDIIESRQKRQDGE